jgi:hypothetical protein
VAAACNVDESNRESIEPEPEEGRLETLWAGHAAPCGGSGACQPQDFPPAADPEKKFHPNRRSHEL